MDQVPVARVAVYSGEDADAAWRLCLHLESRLDGLAAANALRRRGSAAHRSAGRVGVQWHPPRPDAVEARLSDDMGRQLERIEKEIYALAGHPFNIGSLPQLRKVLFEELKLPVQGKTGVTGAPSTDQETLGEAGRPGLAGQRVAAQDSGTAADRQAQKHLCGRPAGDGQPGRRGASRLVQPNGGGDGSAIVIGPEFAEHPGAPRARPGNPPGVSAGARAGGC